MSHEERQTEIGRTAEGFAESKKHLATLQARVLRYGDYFAGLSQSLRIAPKTLLSSMEIATAGFANELNNYPSAKDLLEAFHELKSEMERYERLKSALKEMGLDLKD